MPPHYVIFWGLLLFTCGYALVIGRKYERLAATVFLAATVASWLAHSPVNVRYVAVETSDLIVDSAVLLAVVAIALVSDRFWPLWVAGLQLVDSFSHFLKAVDMSLLPRVYATAERFWSVPILLILFVGAWRQRRRSRAEAAGTDSPLLD